MTSESADSMPTAGGSWWLGKNAPLRWTMGSMIPPPYPLIASCEKSVIKTKRAKEQNGQMPSDLKVTRERRRLEPDWVFNLVSNCAYISMALCAYSRTSTLTFFRFNDVQGSGRDATSID